MLKLYKSKGIGDPGGVGMAGATFQMLWGEAQSELTPEDWAEYQRLCQPESPDFILNLPDYYAFFTYSMFRGKVVV